MIYNGTLNASLSDYKCNSCTLYIALFVVILVTSIDISSAFIYIHWYLKKYPKILLPVKMRTLKSINIKIRPYFFNSMTNIKNFDPNVLSIDQVSFEKKNTDCVIYEFEYFKNFDSANSLYLIFNNVHTCIEYNPTEDDSETIKIKLRQ